MKEVSLRGLPAKERQSTLNEVNVLKRVVHPNAIGYRDSFNDRDTLCIVMEYASGGDLSGLIANRKRAQKRFSEEEILRMSYQLISALAYCHHDLHMLHRELRAHRTVGKHVDGCLKRFSIVQTSAATWMQSQYVPRLRCKLRGVGFEPFSAIGRWPARLGYFERWIRVGLSQARRFNGACVHQ
eukprot:6213247-Pleurochrysis_carterae.AAC.1